MPQANYLIVGGGIIGLALARELLRRGEDGITLLEKEEALGVHASGKNSGVLHSGIFYPQDTLKARFCRLGNASWKEFCRERGLPLLEKGKVIVATREGEEDLRALKRLLHIARENHLTAHLVDVKELQQIEPYATTFERALYCPLTANISPLRILQALKLELLASGKVQFKMGTKFLRPMGQGQIMTEQGPLTYRYLINAAGAHSLPIAHQYGLGRKYLSMPFRGSFRSLSSNAAHLVQGNIYAIPDPNLPFLGVHFSRHPSGEVSLGPNSFPALGPEHYSGLPPMGRELWRSLALLGSLLWGNKKVRRLGLAEIKRNLPSFHYREAARLVPKLKREDILSTYLPKTGIRPQLVDRETKELVMDYVIEKGERSLHVLNSISPAFTCALPFASFLVDQLES